MRKCRICSSEALLFSSNNVKIYKCSNCGFGSTDEVGLQKGDYHRDDTYIEEEGLFKNIFRKRVKIISRFIKKGSVLEVGCSTGLMLSILKEKGWGCVGVEVSKKAASVAHGRGIKVLSEPFERVQFDKKFDVIIFNHTLEHLSNPEQVLSKAVGLLNKGGVLYIDLPNFGGISALAQKADWPLLLPQEHLWHFTLKSLQILLLRNNLKVVFSEKASGIWDLDNPVEEVVTALLHFKRRLFKELLTAIPSLFVTFLGVGSDLMIIAKKEN